MRLKRLELLGYKTFAERIEFVFDSGITAIVGPNGSGKSNIADAVRWVLGEQSFSLLRAKKSEDMIFSGSERRARMGMAEATITLDNSDRWLDVDFAEVAITRRSYRSGENEYLVNGSRVRLRDIVDLLAKSGLSKRTYTVIGQGLVDAALALRPQERRTLIEEAAGLTLYQSRRSDALDKLEETQWNVLRVRDLLGEITPRLKRLQQQAERAREHNLVRQDLEQALRVWYGYRWRRGQEELRRIRSVVEYQVQRLDAQRQAVKDLELKMAGLRSRHSELRAQMAKWHQESSALHAQSEALQRQLAVAEERRRLLVQRHDETLSEIILLEASRSRYLERVDAVTSELSSLAATLEQQQAALEAAQTAVEARDRAIAELRAAQDRARGKVSAFRTQAAELNSQLAHLAERRQELRGALGEHRVQIDAFQRQVALLDDQLDAICSDLDGLEAQARKVDEQRDQSQEQLETLRERERGLSAQKNQVEQRLGRLRERYEVLTRMREEGAGLYDGVRNVLEAAGRQGRSSHSLRGILGTVAELIEVPSELEVAVETALGGQLQDLIVETWQDAQAAIEHLRRTRGGRATFLPLDTLRPGRSISVPNADGVLGLASGLVRCSPQLRIVVHYLLGRTIVCQDLNVARRVLDRQQDSYQIVTLEGELVRSSGAVTGGTRQGNRRGGLLAREREWRDLPRQLQELEGEQASIEEMLQVVISQSKEVYGSVSELAIRHRDLAEKRTELEREQIQLQQKRDRARQEHDWRRSLMDDCERELGQQGERETRLRLRLAQQNEKVSIAEAEASELEVRLGQAGTRDLDDRLRQERAEVATIQQQRAAFQAEREGYRRSLDQVERQIQDRQERTSLLTAQLAETESHIQELRQREDRASAETQTFADLLQPAERELERIEEHQVQLEDQEARTRTRLQDLESRYGRVQVELTRQEDRMESLRRQIKDDLGLVELDLGADLSGQPLLPLGSLVSSLPEVAVLPEGLEEQVSALKRRLKRLEPVNPDAPTEYAEVFQRHQFLSTQAQDLEQASADLRQIITELDQVIEHEFRRTFTAIAREFKNYFSQLFGGGSAQLELTDRDDLMNTGIEIVARPPGKRQQGLALLSGGERALTAAALIFAILAISPTPFCVLDEVDAALDEANVGRFRSILKALSKETQFVIITHNRYTIEIADIVYGVSMNPDGSSCVISHQFKQEPVADAL